MSSREIRKKLIGVYPFLLRSGVFCLAGFRQEKKITETMISVINTDAHTTLMYIMLVLDNFPEKKINLKPCVFSIILE